MERTLSPDKFVPGTTVVVERRIGQHQRKAVTRVIGAHPPRYLLLDRPLVKERPLLDPDDENCIVRFLQGGNAYGFRANVVSQPLDPFPMLVVTYPTEFQQVPVRSDDRIGCGIQGRLSRPEDAPELPEEVLPKNPLVGTILDLSTGGCQMAVPMIDPDNPALSDYAREKGVPPEHHGDYLPRRLQTMCPQDAHLDMAVTLPPPWPAEYERIGCKIRWTKTFRGFFLVGLQFVEYPTDFLENIRRTIEHQIKYFSQPF